MELKIKKELKPGLNRLVIDELEFLRFSMLVLDEGETFEESLTEWECAAVLLCGSCEVEVEGEPAGVMGPRKNVFDDLPWGLYVPDGKSYRIRATSPCEIALSYAPGKSPGESVLIGPEDVVVHQRGKPGFEREVRDIVVDRVDANSILAGETVNRPGQWSSYPPHKHDTSIPDVESQLEEIYFYKVNPPQGFGYQRIYTDDRSLDQAVTVENNDLVILPQGYHPVAAAPGYSVYYLWVLAGPRRKMVPHDDPLHKWILMDTI